MRTQLTAILAVASCLDGSPEKDSGAPPCPYDIESFCLYEFGGGCPTFDELSAMTCEGVHFVETGGDTPRVGGTDECPGEIVSCVAEADVADAPVTRIHLSGDGDGEIVAVELRWYDDPSCPGGRMVFGDPGC